MNPETIRSLLGPAAFPMESMLAAPVRGQSLPQFRGSADPQLESFFRNPNLPASTKQRVLQEIGIRQQFGTWGVPGATPIDPLMG